MKNLKTKKLLLALLASVVIPVSAQTTGDDGVEIVIHGLDGSKTECLLNDVQKLTFQDDYFTLLTKDGQSRFFNYDETGRIVFTGIETGIEQITPEGVSTINISYDGRNINITGCKAPEQLSIYDVSGRPMIRTTVQGDTNISTESLSNGVYILKLNNRTFKFSR